MVDKVVGTAKGNIPEKTPSEELGTRVWLITFTDLVALMLAFFVMLFAMSSVKVNDWQSVIDSLSQTLRPSEEKTLPAATSVFNIGTIFRKNAINLDYLASVLMEAVESHPLLSTGRVMRLEDRLVITLPGDFIFGPGGALMTDQGRQALFVLGGVLRNIGNKIGVNGHSGPSRSGGDDYTSHWELSTARAAAVANALRQSGYTDDITAFGYADGRLGQLSDLSDADRSALAGRIEVIIRPTAGDL
ncbi:MAG: OmpA family protein [Proteobacteria bacterium]|nr:OmpA family protein [Pseudomonadota bacterium]